jgi:predicted DCC family thiol-disulfide oxidoreductase YuxK
MTNLDFDWEATAKGVFEKDDRPVILFDGVCNLCNGGVNFALDHDSVGNFRFASLQSKVGQSLLIRAGKKPNDISSIVLVTPNEAYFKSDAVIRIAAKLEGNPLLPLMGTLGPFVPRFVRNTVYDFVAKNRYRFGEADQCRMDFDNEYGSRFVSDKS